ncbi:MAG: hypothetical protein HKO65_08650 [Gemmatimonadetes bacterium]|nr:hypothetical protein [Gemmatimonadota bacterium]
MNRRLPHWLGMVGIVTAAFGCDNVSFGGMSVSLEGPPRDSLDTEGGTSVIDPDAGPTRFRYGPLLYAGARQGDSVLVVPVGELVEGRLEPLPAGEAGVRLAEQILEERLMPSRKLTLFQQGGRVGTLTVSSALGTSSEYCSPRAQAIGTAELIPSASGSARFLALEQSVGEERPYGIFQTSSVERPHRIGIQNLGGEALNDLRAQWPGTLQNIREDLQVLRISDDQNPSIIGTFLFQDQMAVGPAPDPAYSLMILGELQGVRFTRAFTWYRRVGDEGKGAPRFFSKLDWDGDGEEELLLEVFGAESRWFAALEKEGGSWTLAFQDPCGAPGDGPGPS